MIISNNDYNGSHHELHYEHFTEQSIDADYKDIEGEEESEGRGSLQRSLI